MVEKVDSGLDTNCQHQAQRMVNNLLKNGSFNDNYHQKYYYPQLIIDRIRKRNKEKSANLFQDAVDLRRATSVALARAFHSAPEISSGAGRIQEEPLSVLSASSLSDTEKIAEISAPSNANEYPHFYIETFPQDISQSQYSGDSVQTKNYPTWEVSFKKHKDIMSTDSVTSEDSSVFSEDYSMTDYNTECFNSVPCCGSARRRAGDGSEDADSSFSSPCSSCSTLEADGKDNGGCVKDIGTKDKVKAGTSPSSQAIRCPDIRLIIGNTEVDTDAEGVLSPLPSPEMDGGCEGNEGYDPDSGDVDPGDGSGSFYEDREFDFLKAEPVRRSTSLKTYKTPPGTPRRKKAVRFADALGLDLESVRHILNLEEPPEVPKSAMNDLKIGLEDAHKSEGVKYLSALFSQPGADPAFAHRVQEGKVALENCIVDDKDMSLTGTVRVSNIHYHKKVLIRYTTNNWLTNSDITASYVQSSNDGPTDRFSFTLTVPTYFSVGQRLEMAVMFNAGGQNFWDNNYGKNYAVECYARAMPTCESDNTWMHFL